MWQWQIVPACSIRYSAVANILVSVHNRLVNGHICRWRSIMDACAGGWLAVDVYAGDNK
jgi:hypothetical protein